jgi:tetratricopeptide (TPR) repeat protein
LGVYYFYQNEYDKSVAHFSKSLEFLPNNPKVYGKLAMIMFIRNDLTLAERYARKALKQEPDDSEHHNTLGWILLKKGEVGKAIKSGKKALMAGSDNASPYLLLGEAYRLKEALKTALSYFQTYFRRHPEHVSVTLALIELYSLLDDQTSLLQSVHRLLCLNKGGDLPSLIRDYNRIYNCLDDNRTKRIIDAIQNTIIRQSAGLNKSLEKGVEIGKQHDLIHEQTH